MRRNVIAGAIVGVLAVSAAVGVPVAVNASNAAHAQEVRQIADAKAASVVVRADGARDAVLAGSATQAGVIAQQEAEAKAAAEKAAQEAAAAQAAAQAAAAQAAQQAQQATDESSGSGDSGPALCPAGTTANAVDANGNESNCQPDNPTTGQPCVAYDANNNCTAWLKP